MKLLLASGVSLLVLGCSSIPREPGATNNLAEVEEDLSDVKVTGTRIPLRNEITSLEKEFLETRFALLTAVAALPPGIRSLIAPVPMPIADPGEHFVSADLLEEDVPMQRLVVGGRTGSIGFAVFDSGGYGGPYRWLLIAKYSDDVVSAFCQIRFRGSVESIDTIKAAVLKPLFAKPSGYGCR